MIDLITLALAKKGGSSGGVTPEEMAAAIQSAIGTALANYYTKTETDEEFANYTPTDGVGADIAVSMDSSYNLTVSLKNAESETLGSNTVNLPLESMVVGGAYADGVLTLTLNNGQTLDIPISDIIDGLVSESRTIAGIPLTSDIDAEDLREAIGAGSEGVVLSMTPSDDFSHATVGGATFAEAYAALSAGKSVTGYVDIGSIVFPVNVLRYDDEEICFYALATNPQNGIYAVPIYCWGEGEDGNVAYLEGFYDIQNVQPDWNAASDSPAAILNKPTLFSGNYNDLTNKPTIPVVPTNLVTGYNNTAYTMRPLTQSQYNALGTKDANTLYLITG